LNYAHATAVDVSREVVEFCNGIIPGSTTQIDDTVAHLALQRGRYERVFALHVLEHFPKPDGLALVRAVWGALRPGGWFVVEVPNMANLFTGAYLRAADFTHEAGYAEQSLRQLLEACGFAEVVCFEDRLAGEGLKRLVRGGFRTAAALVQRVIYRGYELPVPRVLTPALCAAGQRPAGGT
jgi:2-polyprenyl-3-methyl-5-hydroxy-6-metoxy-1,4-benzoquinol methylase